MFKRANKVTALLVAAAAVVSLVPASAANAAERLGTKEGTIESAIAFKDGKYIYEGYKTDDDSKSVYFNGGEKDKPLDEVKDADDLARYGEKYAYMHDGSDQYLVDLTSGKVIDDESPVDKADNASTKLRTALKKTDRYGKELIVKIQGRDENHKDKKDNDEVVQNQFGDVWYSYAVKPEDDSKGAKDKVNDKLYGFTNESGKYVDASKLANIYAYSTERKKIVKIEKFNDLDKDSKLTVNLKEAPKAIAQDKDYIYAVTKVEITDSSSDSGTSKATVGVNFDKITTTAGAHLVFNGSNIDTNMQGLDEKAQEKKLKTIKADLNAWCVRHDLDGYEYNQSKNEYIAKDGGMKTKPAADKFDSATMNFNDGQNSGNNKHSATYLQKISKAQGEKEDDAYLPKSVDSYQFDDESLFKSGDVHDAYKAVLLDDDDFNKEDNQYRVKDNTLYVTRVKSGKVKVFKLKMKKIKEDPIKGATLDDKTKLDGYVVIKDGDADQDINKTDHFKDAVSVDVDGNTWCIDEGKIYKFNGTDKKEMFTCDRSLDTLNVYNEGSLIAWENGEDVYTTVQEGKAVSDKEVTPAKIGWQNTAAGWTFFDGAGKQVIGSNKWVNPGGVWYMIKADGIMATGWFNDNGTWYFLDTTSGAMKTGWFNDNGTWYYLQSSGAMKTGWFNVDGSWYYLNANGSMAANTTVDGYTLGANGAWVK